MISFLKTWAESLIFAILCIVMIEMILPEGSHKKYIKVVLGVYLLLVLMNPLISKLTKTTDLTNMLDMSQFAQENTWEVSSFNTDSELEYMTKESLKLEIERLLQQNGYQASQIEMEFEIKKDHTEIEMTKLSLKIEKDQTEKIKQIEEVKIQVSDNQQEENQRLTAKEIAEVKEILASELGVKKKNIYLIGEDEK